MAQGQFQLSQTNPNNSTGGGGCICDELQQTDCKAPFVVCYGNTMDSSVSPHVVACARCIGEMSALLGSEALTLDNPGDADTVNPTGISQPFPELRPKRPQPRKKTDESEKPLI